MRPLLLLLSLLGIGLAAVPALAQPPIHEQLQQAVDDQDWDQAITIMDQLIEAEDQDKVDLEAYRDSLIQRQTGESTEPMQAPSEFLTYTLEPSLTLDQAKTSLQSICLSELTTLATPEAKAFCQCTVEQLQLRHDLVELVTDPESARISPKETEQIYQVCVFELDPL